MLGSMVPSLIPSGRYKLEMDSFSVTHNETIFTMVIIIDVRHTLLVNWWFFFIFSRTFRVLLMGLSLRSNLLNTNEILKIYKLHLGAFIESFQNCNWNVIKKNYVTLTFARCDKYVWCNSYSNCSYSALRSNRSSITDVIRLAFGAVAWNFP